ncbi:hypothetical protein BGZ83_004390 [Gryganskiella cystojenkinii]|nr:hypothetical protein BGZ83_004390 [Gryganskiella cystojenkinii]
MAPVGGKEKSLSIHIDTPYFGPNGLPLIYGSTPEKAGSFKGVVRFVSNYDCKGRDIVILYEAKAEAQWTALENKKNVNHHTEEVFARQLWYFPLTHTKRSVVAAGTYEKEFQVSFNDFPSTSDTNGNGAGTKLAPLPRSTLSAVSLLPSSSLGTYARIKYTIKAVLRRPFPCVTDVETSQEIWVLHSSLLRLPSFSPLSLPHQHARPSTFSSSDHSQFQALNAIDTVEDHAAAIVSGRQENNDHTESRKQQQQQQQQELLTSGDDNSVTLLSPHPSTPLTKTSSGSIDGDSDESQPPSRSLLSMATPSKVLKSAMAFLPSIDLSRTRQLLTSTTTSTPSSSPPPAKISNGNPSSPLHPPTTSIPSPSAKTTMIPGETYHSTLHSPRLTTSPTIASAAIPQGNSPSSPSSPRSCKDSGRTSSVQPPYNAHRDHHNLKHPYQEQQDVIDYTGVWEPFQIPYTCSIPSETVHLGQLFPLTIQFGPLPRRPFPPFAPAAIGSTSIFHTVVPLSRTSNSPDPLRVLNRGRSGSGSSRTLGNGRIQKRASHGRAATSHQASKSVSIQKPDVHVNGIGLNGSKDGHGGNSSNDGSDGLGELRFLVKKGILKVVEHTILREVTVMPTGHIASMLPPSSSSGRTASPGPGIHLNHRRSRSSMVYQEQLYSASHPALTNNPSLLPPSPALSTRQASILANNNNDTSNNRPPPPPLTLGGEKSKSKNFFFKRRSLDQPLSPTDIIKSAPLPLSPTLTHNTINGKNKGTTKVISTIEAKFKTEATVISLTPTLRERELRYQYWVSQSDSNLDEDDLNSDNKSDDNDDHHCCGSSSSNSNSELDEEDESDFILEEDEGIWRTTVWVQLPDTPELSTCTETKHIQRTHTLQLILLCGVLGLATTPPNSGANVVATAASAGRRPLIASTSSSTPSTSSRFTSSTMPSANKEFRLESKY